MKIWRHPDGRELSAGMRMVICTDECGNTSALEPIDDLSVFGFELVDKDNAIIYDNLTCNSE